MSSFTLHLNLYKYVAESVTATVIEVHWCTNLNFLWHTWTEQLFNVHVSISKWTSKQHARNHYPETGNSLGYATQLRRTCNSNLFSEPDTLSRYFSKAPWWVWGLFNAKVQKLPFFSLEVIYFRIFKLICFKISKTCSQSCQFSKNQIGILHNLCFLKYYTKKSPKCIRLYCLS